MRAPTQLAHPLLKAAGSSSVVMIGSVAGGPLAVHSGSIYAMTKAALDQLTAYLACEWAADGIRINCVKVSLRRSCMCLGKFMACSTDAAARKVMLRGHDMHAACIH